jgi:8-amino-7-oxononanoate synthase
MSQPAKSRTDEAPLVVPETPELPSDLTIEGMVRDRYDGQKERDIFAKTERFKLIDQAREYELYPFFQALDNNDGPEAQIYGRRVLMFGSNNYLGLTRHPEVVQAAAAALKKYGTSMTGSRLLNGTTHLHEELEARIARFLNKERALVFTTGYQTNLGTISSLIDKRSVAVVDKADHASIYDGATLADGECVRFRHNDARHLDSVLKRIGSDQPRLVIIDGVYSMGGDIADLPGIIEACKRHQARLLVDDAHGVGVIGVGGRGTASHFGVEDDVDLVMGTFSKSLASIGGFVAGPYRPLEWIQHFARSMLFSASLPPASAAAALTSLDILERDPGIVERLRRNGDEWREGLRSMGFNIGQTETPIVPVAVGDEYTTMTFYKDLLQAGVYTNPSIYPAVNMREAMLRTSCMATHTAGQIEQALETFRTVGKRHGLIP